MDQPQMYVPEIAELYPPQGLWTEADYLRLPHSTRVIELNVGRLTISPAPSHEHQRIGGDLAIALDRYADSHQLGEVLFAPIAVRLRFNLIRMPDLVFIGRGHEHRKRKMWIEGPPDWVAEIISPFSRSIDEGEKVTEYALAAIPEYWLIDPEQQQIWVYNLSDELPEYRLAGSYGPGMLARSEILAGFEIALSDLF